MTRVMGMMAVAGVLVGCGKTAEDRLFPACDKKAAVACLDMMKGKIAGQEWRFRYGTAVQPVGSNVWAVSLSDQPPPADACGILGPFPAGTERRKIEFFVKELKVGELDYTMGSGKGSVSFSKRVTGTTSATGEAVAGFGKGSITGVDGASFSGRLDVRADDLNHVAGQFVVKLCP